MKQFRWFCIVLLVSTSTAMSSEPPINGFYVGWHAGWERIEIGAYEEDGLGVGAYAGFGKMIGDGYAAFELEVNHGSDHGVLEKQISFGGHALLGMSVDTSIWYLRVGGMSTRFEVQALGFNLRDWESSVTGGLGVMMPLFEPVSVRLEYLHKWYLDTGSIDMDEDIVRLGLTYHL